MGKRWYAVIRGRAVGVMEKEAALEATQGVKGAFLRSFKDKGEAERFFRRAQSRGEVRTLGGGSPGDNLYMAYTDGSGRGSASAVLALDGRVVAQGHLALPGVQDPGEAEARAFLLALLMTPRGGQLRLHTDRADLASLWERGKEDAWGLTPILRALAEALEVKLEVRWVPRREVKEAHEAADQAAAARWEAEAKSAHVNAFLERLPHRYRASALNLLERFLSEEGLYPERLKSWLGRGRSQTRTLLLEHLPEGKNLLRLLRSIAGMNGAAREAVRDKDRERAWAEKPPTEKQLRFLHALGYSGPAPESVLAASQLIAELVRRKAFPPGERSG